MSRDPEHADAVLRLSDYARGRLDAAGRAEVAAHLAQCDECPGMLEAYAMLAAACGPDTGGAMNPHLTSAAIAALAVGDRDGAPAPDEARHLDSCQDCAQELRMARAANEDPAGARSTTMRWLLPLAAVLAVAILGLATISALRRSGALPGRIAALESDNAALRSQVADLSRVVAEQRTAEEERTAAAHGAAGGAASGEEGAIPYLLLHATVRGAGGVERLALRSGQSSVYVALAIEIPATARRPGEGGRVVLVDATGREAWAADLDGAAIDALVASGGALLLRIPAAALSAGRMEARVAPATPGGGKRVWFRSALEVTGPGRGR
jgi:hypothetical protein